MKECRNTIGKSCYNMGIKLTYFDCIKTWINKIINMSRLVAIIKFHTNIRTAVLDSDSTAYTSYMQTLRDCRLPSSYCSTNVSCEDVIGLYMRCIAFALACATNWRQIQLL